MGQGGRVNWQGVAWHCRASQHGDMAYIGAVVDGKSQVMPCVQVSASLAVCIRNVLHTMYAQAVL